MARQRKRVVGGSRPLPPEKQRAKVMPVRLTDSERALIDRAAELDHERPLSWARQILAKAAEQRITHGMGVETAFALAVKSMAENRK